MNLPGSIAEQKNFGYLYEGLKELKMSTFDVVAYLSYLNKHNGHRMHLFCDCEDEFPPEIPEDFEGISSFEYDGNGFVDAYYEIHCNTCGLTTRLDHTDTVKILPFEEFEIKLEQQELFAIHALAGDYFSDIYDNYLKAMDLLSFVENIENLYLFIYEHFGHRLTARLSKDHNVQPIVTSVELKSRLEAKLFGPLNKEELLSCKCR